MKHKISFVILHYETLNDTENCVDSLLKYIDGDRISIIIVDNGSSNGKTDCLKEKYKNISQIYFIDSENNLGFAKGNNLGFLYAKTVLNAQLIILSNNDIVYEQKDFIEGLEKYYGLYKFDVAGPKIISLVDNKNQNPVPVLYKDIKSINRRIIKYYILYLLSFINLDTKIQKIFAKEVMEFSPKKYEDFQLHGACMIFGENYVNTFDGLYDKTFMYGEESILKHIIKENNMKMNYIKELNVFHKEGASTNAIYGKGKSKRQFYYRWNIHSCKLLKELKNK